MISPYASRSIFGRKRKLFRRKEAEAEEEAEQGKEVKRIGICADS